MAHSAAANQIVFAHDEDACVEDLSKFSFADSPEEADGDSPASSDCSESESSVLSLPLSKSERDATIRASESNFNFSPTRLSTRFKTSTKKRCTQWVLKHFSQYPVKMKEKHYKKLRKYCVRGLPNVDRSLLWYLLASRLSTAPIVTANSRRGSLNFTGSFDDHLVHLCRSYSSVYPNPKWSDLILKDLRRCIPEDEKFNNADGIGYKALNKVLFAFSIHNSDVGYCQGLGPLVAFILNVFNEGRDCETWEWEKVFWIVHYLNSDNRYMRDYNTPGLKGVIVDLWLFGQMAKKYLPKQTKILGKFGFEPTLYAQAWFFCLFVRTLPAELCVRIWDIYICEGKFIMFKTAILILYIVCHNCKDLIKEGNIEDFLHALQHPEPKWFKTEKFIEKLTKFKIDGKAKRKFLEQAESYRYEQFGAIHTITSTAPELAFDNEAEGNSEIESDRCYFTDDGLDNDNLSSVYDDDDSEYKFVPSNNSLSKNQSNLMLPLQKMTNPLSNLIHVEIDCSQPSGDDTPSITRRHFGSSSMGSDTSQKCTTRDSPVALSACSSSTSEHKESQGEIFDNE